MKIAVVDDEQVWRTATEEKIRSFYDFPVEVLQYESGEAFLAADKKFAEENLPPFDLVFLDVEMDPGINGFDTTIAFKACHQNTPVILLTAHGEFSRRGYRVNAFRYLDKQYMNEIEEALTSLGIINPADHWLTLPLADGGSRQVREMDICYIETFSHGTIIHTVKEKFRSALTIQKIGQLLKKEGEEEDFFKCHQAYIVHWKYADEIKGENILMKDGTVIQISRRNLKEANFQFFRYRYRRASM